MKLALLALTFLLLTFAGGVAKNQRLSADIRDTRLADAVALLSAESGVTIVAEESVRDVRVTLQLRDVGLTDALLVLARTNRLMVRREGTAFVVGPSYRTVVLPLARGNAEDVARAMVSLLPEGAKIFADKRTDSIVVGGDAMVVERARWLAATLDAPVAGDRTPHAAVLRLRFLRPSDVVKDLKGMLPDGSYVADDRQNALVVIGSPERQAMARAFVASVDVPTPEVLFEVRVADLQPVNDFSNIGIAFGGVDLAGSPIGGSATYAFTRNSLQINARLNALVTQGRAQILATPKLVALNNREADLLIGQTYPVVYYDGQLGGQHVQFVDVGVKLRLTPTIGFDGSITADVHPEYSAIEGFVAGYPILANRKIDTTLRVKDNESIVLGGLLRDIDSETVSKLPGLANIPVFGKIFQNRQHTRERDEVVFFITPHILAAGAP